MGVDIVYGHGYHHVSMYRRIELTDPSPNFAPPFRHSIRLPGFGRFLLGRIKKWVSYSEEVVRVTPIHGCLVVNILTMKSHFLAPHQLFP